MTSSPSFTEAQLSAAVNAIRSYDSVVVVGAGLSAFGYPMTSQLPALLWQAIEDASAQDELRVRSGKVGSPKEILGVDGNLMTVGWQLVREAPTVRLAFQTAFAQLDAERDPSQAHFDLACLIRLGRVRCVISYNWDSCLERAYEQLYGIALPDDTLFKPHGDVHNIDGTWTLPDEDGLVPDSVLGRLEMLAPRPHTLVVIGYSESDENVVETLLRPLSRKWPVVRVGPSVRGEGAVPGMAGTVLSSIVHALGSTDLLQGWRHVTFKRSRDFGAALRGERLRPTDVDACPEFPAASRLATRLTTSKFATVSGSSGSGKSITAFHAARRMNRNGWAVVELKRPGIASEIDIAEFVALSGPVIAVVDDAQAIDAGVLAGFEACVDDQHAVLIVSTERLEIRNDETLIASQSQQIIYDHCVANVAEVGVLLHQMDDRVAKSSSRETPLRRLETAYRSTSEPWLFMFVASGGERRITGALDRAVARRTTALVLATISIAQMTTQDAGIQRSALDSWLIRHWPKDFETYGVLDSALIDSALQDLAADRLISLHAGRIRASHIRIADRALVDLCSRAEGDMGATILAAIRLTFLDADVSIAGKFWLLRTFDRVQAFRWSFRSTLDAEVMNALVAQCEQARSGRERGTALNLLWAAEFIRKLTDVQATVVADLLIDSINNVTADETNGIRWMLNGLRSRHEPAYAYVKRSISPQVLAANFSTSGTRSSAMDWADFMHELAERFDSPRFNPWRTQFRAGIDEKQLGAWLGDTDKDSQAFEIYDLIGSLAEFVPDVALATFRACAPNIRATFHRDLVDATGNFGGWAFGLMLQVAALADSPGACDDDDDDDAAGDDELTNDDASVAEASRREALWGQFEHELKPLAQEMLAFFQAIDWNRATDSLVGKERHELGGLDIFLWWIGTLSLEILDEIVTLLSTDWLDSLAVPQVSTRPGDVSDLSVVAGILIGLSATPLGHDFSRRFAERHEPALEVFPSQLIELFPEIAARMILSGRTLGTTSPRGAGWTQITKNLTAIGGVDIDAQSRYLRASAAVIQEAIQSPQSYDLKGISRFIDVSDSIDSSVLDTVMHALDTPAATQGWRDRLEEAPQSVFPLLSRAASTTSAAGKAARGMLEALSEADG